MAQSVFLDLDQGYSPSASIIPAADNTYDLGSATFQWRSLYLGTSLVLADAATVSWSDVVLSRTSANLLQLASGDSFQTIAGTLTANRTALATTSTDGLRSVNTTAATGAVTVQISPRTLWQGNAWDTAASETVAFFAETLPATAATPTGTWKLGYSLNGAAATYPMTLSSIGALTATGTIIGDNLQVPTTGAISFGATGSGRARLQSPSDGFLNLFNTGATAAIAFDNGAAANGQVFSAVKVLTELTTIAAAATTDTTIQMPANSVVLAVSVRVTTVIPTAATFTVGDSGSAARFSTAAVSTAATSTDPGTKAGAYYNASALSIRITPNAQPADNTGRVRVTIYYYTVTPPTS